MKTKNLMFTLVIVVPFLIASTMNAQTNMKDKTTSNDGINKGNHDHAGMMPDIKSWPEASRMAADDMMGKYGKPDAMGAEMLGWMDKGNWKTIHVSKKETKHSFPIEHTDMMEQCISYKVPTDKMDELGVFDGSITFDRTQGLMCARCDKEGNNFLALNLANDIVTGKKSVDQARKEYGETIKEKMNGGNPAYMQKLTFSMQSNVSDPDQNTTGLTKEDVMKGMKKTTGEK